MIEEQSVIIDRAAALGPMDAHVIRMGSPSPDSLSSSSQSQSSHPSSPVSDESITIFDVLSKEIKRKIFEIAIFLVVSLHIFLFEQTMTTRMLMN
jgi:hypothetical protein